MQIEVYDSQIDEMCQFRLILHHQTTEYETVHDEISILNIINSVLLNRLIAFVWHLKIQSQMNYAFQNKNFWEDYRLQKLVVCLVNLYF